jgi:polysaccharide biosynthesis/export protein
MQGRRAALRRAGLAVLLALALAGCTLPRSGPTTGQILASGSAEGVDLHIVDVGPGVAAASRSFETLGFGPDLVGAGALSPETIAPGDTLAVSVWENVEAGLLAGVGQKVTALEELQVDQGGDIFVPYAGRIEAAGRTPDSLRRAITEALAPQTPDPQVEVRRTAGDGRTVSVMGGVAAPGVYPIDTPTLRLSAMLAAAGGVSLVPDVAQIRVQRRGGGGGRIWLQDLYDNPAYDIALRPGDRIVVEEDRRAFTALGATGQQARVRFTEREMTAVDALAAAGGLDGRSADPTGVFVFRQESGDVANRVLSRGDLVGPQRVAYVLNLTEPAGLVSAREFLIRDGDTVYVTEAPFATWSRVIGSATSAINFAAAASALAEF